MATAAEATGQFIKIKPSLLPFTWKGLIVLALGFAALAGRYVLQLSTMFSFASGYVLTFASLTVIGLGVLVILIGIVRRNMYTYTVTDSHIAIQKQLLRRSVRRIPFSSLSDLEVSQSLMGRLAGFGNIVPVTKSGYGLVHGVEPSENAVAEMRNVPHPDKVANLIMSRASLMSKVGVLR